MAPRACGCSSQKIRTAFWLTTCIEGRFDGPIMGPRCQRPPDWCIWIVAWWSCVPYVWQAWRCQVWALEGTRTALAAEKAYRYVCRRPGGGHGVALLSDAAFRLYVFLCLNVDRHNA